MPFENGFYIENIDSINKLTSKILFMANLLCPIFLVLTHFGIFKISLEFSLLTEALVLFFTVVQCILVFKLHLHKIPMLFGLVGMATFIAFLGTNTHVGIYISYGIIPFLSCLYYNVKLTRVITIYCYFSMLASLYIKGLGLVDAGREASALYYTIAMGAGYTIEFMFVYAMSVSIAKRYRFSIIHAQERSERLYRTQMELMNFIPKILESHEVFTGHHVRHTVTYVALICQKLVQQGFYRDILTENMIFTLSSAANLHDIGKIHIPDDILNKPGKFTPAEYEMMKSHAEEGKKLIESLPIINDGEFNRIASEIAYCHHEKFDGTGYPQGIKGFDIPLCARIMAAADVLDALISWRPYKDPFTIEKTMKIFEESKGSHFEPCIADAVISLQEEIRNISEKFQENDFDGELSEYNWRNQLKQGRI